MAEFVFFHRSLSPHAVPLARALAKRGYRVRVVVIEELTQGRLALGWERPEVSGLEVIRLEPTVSRQEIRALLAPSGTHLLQGLPRWGILRRIHKELARSGVVFGSIMEQVDDRGLQGSIKRLEYALRLRGRLKPRFILGIGTCASSWFERRSAGRQEIYPFAYFLEDHSMALLKREESSVFRIGYVGQLVPGKRVDLLLEALGRLRSSNAQLVVIGRGSLEGSLRAQAQVIASTTRIEWRGVVPLREMGEQMQSLDVLVLPSDYDGWGAVISEAMAVGVPVICSSACGASVAVDKAPYGAVFERGSVESLQGKLAEMVKRGPLEMDARIQLGIWARCLNASSGARYLEEIVRHLDEPLSPRPAVPWEATKRQ